jgi:hypothetical protein
MSDKKPIFNVSTCAAAGLANSPINDVNAIITATNTTNKTNSFLFPILSPPYSLILLSPSDISQRETLY